VRNQQQKKKKKVAEIQNRNVNANSFKQGRTNFKTIINIIIIQLNLNSIRLFLCAASTGKWPITDTAQTER
jgi:hypothetical protein